ncbi:hypothetical protein H0H87_004924 [Tephrocybe sp. NHM501043]|nr:hypothetical protein H0H87_004924 [Tephrocybe sp. NHM501043]
MYLCQNRIMEELHGRQEAQVRRQFLKTFLYPKTTTNVAYDQQEKVPCDDDTRTEVLAEIREWINDVSHSSRNFLWLTGDPGCGKSAVTASVARECKDRKILWAQLFINRNIIDTTNPNLYFPSIARQLADYSELVERQIHAILTDQPSIMDGISSMQATKLFLLTLGAAAAIDIKTPVVVVIDALDETQREHLETTATIFSHLFDALSGHRNVKVFISSRTEDGIQKPFSKTMKDKRVKNLHLDTNSPSSIRDVDVYLRRRIAQIAERHGHHPNIWPGEDCLSTLSLRASGHFIWAVTVSRFMQEQMEEWGDECLDSVMDNLGTARGKQDIKVLYGVVLRLAYQKSKDPWAFETFRRVVGAVATALEPLSITQLGHLLDLRREAQSLPVDLHNLVRRLRTVLVSGSGDITGKTVLRLHKSFFEYITSSNSETRFRINLETSNSELALRCLRLIASAHSVVRGILYSTERVRDNVLSRSSLAYALRHCSSHFPSREGKRLGTVIDTPEINLHQLDTLFKCSSNSRRQGPLTLCYPTHRTHISTSLDTHTLFWAVEGSSPIDPIALSHNGTIHDVNSDQEAAIKGGWMESGDDCNADEISCLAFSPDGAYVASGSIYGTVWVWDMHTLLPTTLRPIRTTAERKEVKSLAFSTDGRKFAIACSIDLPIGIFDMWTDKTTTQKITSDNVDDDNIVMVSVTFSPSGIVYIIGCDQTDQLVRVWSSVGGQLAEIAAFRHPEQIHSVALSSDCMHLISCSGNYVDVWDIQTRSLSGSLQHHEIVSSAAISPDKDTIASACQDGKLFLWSAITYKPIGNRALVSYGRPRKVVFTPDGTHILTHDWNLDVHLWDRYTGEGVELPNLAGGQICDSVLSPNKEHIVSARGPRILKTITNAVTQSLENTDSVALQASWTSFSPPGNAQIVADSSGGLLLYDSRSGKAVRLPLHKKAPVTIRCAAFSANACRAAGVSIDGSTYLWDLVNLTLLGVSAKTITHMPTSISFASDGETVLLHSDAKLNVALGLDGRRLVVLPEDGDALVHETMPYAIDVHTGAHTFKSKNAPNRCVDTVHWYPTPVDDMIWALVDNHLIRGGADGSFVVVPVEIAR